MKPACIRILFAVLLFSPSVRAQVPAPLPPPVQSRPDKQETTLPVLTEAEKSLEEYEHAKTRQLPPFESFTTSHVGMSFEELWQIALQNNPVVRQKGNLVAAARGGRLQAGLYPNPILTYAGDNLGVDGEAGKHGLSVVQEVVTAKKKKLDRAVASYDVDVARRNYEMECRKLANDLKIVHSELLHAQLCVQIYRYTQDLSSELLSSAKRLQATGKTRSIDVLQFQTTLNEAGLRLRQAENDQEAAWRSLLSILGTPEIRGRAVRGSLLDSSPPRDWDATWTQFLQCSPQLAVARVRAKQAQVYLARQEAERVANFSANLTLSQDVTANNTVPFVGISMPLKIYDRNQGNIARARAEWAAANREVERITLSLHERLACVFRDYGNAREQIEVYEQSIIPDSFEALRLINEVYQKGEITYLELYNQRFNVTMALIHYIDALKTQAVSATLIDGMLLQGTLD